MPPRKHTAEQDGDAMLARIADLLGCDIDAFDEGSDAATELTDAIELLRLWRLIQNRDDRTKLLALARRLART